MLGGLYPGLYAVWATTADVITDPWLSDFIVVPATGRRLVVPVASRQVQVPAAPVRVLPIG
jgi:hypothetical protein